MNRTEFEQVRDLPSKKIAGTIQFKQQPNQKSFMHSRCQIQNSLGVKLLLEINYQPILKSKIFSVFAVESGGKICRLCIDGLEHEPYGECHRHSMLTEDCQRGNLHKEMEALPHLAGINLALSFRYFCFVSRTKFDGVFYGADNSTWVTNYDS